MNTSWNGNDTNAAHNNAAIDFKTCCLGVNQKRTLGEMLAGPVVPAAVRE